MREAHTIKGSSTMLGYKRIAEIAHGIENGLQKALEDRVKLERNHFEIIFKCVDAIGPLLEDKLTWDDAGVSGDFVQVLCQQIADAFLDKSSKKETRPIEAQTKPVIEPTKTIIPPVVTTVVEESIRVDISKLDKLMNLSAELLISKIRLNELVKNLSRKVESSPQINQNCGVIAQELNKVDNNVDFITKNLGDEVLKLRMVAVSHLFNAFPRAMRDLAIKKEKDIIIEIKGEETQLDKAIIDEMKDPLMHILRNAVDHGVESPKERLAKNKSACGKINLNAYQQGSQVVLEISDDGAGIDLELVRQEIEKKGLIGRDKINELSDEQVYSFLFMPGFSTSKEVTDISGRGVGLDVVREKVAKLKGVVEIFSIIDKGTKFTIRLPLTLAITESLFVGCGAETFALPVEHVVETMRVNFDTIHTVEGKEALTVRGSILPLIRLNDIFGLLQRGIMEKKFFLVVVVQSVEKKIGLMVDQILGRQEIVHKNLNQPLSKISGLSGATILGDGRVVLILDVPQIIETAQGLVARLEKVTPKPQISTTKKLKTILLVEDALSTAMLEKNILESSGFSVVIARDGQEALEKASQEKFDLVITDVLMPRMNGFELTRKLKKDNLYKDTPIIIVTTRETDADKREGLEAGADAYILKSEFTSEGLLTTIERLVG